jgi:hypothetical protein
MDILLIITMERSGEQNVQVFRNIVKWNKGIVDDKNSKRLTSNQFIHYQFKKVSFLTFSAEHIRS